MKKFLDKHIVLISFILGILTVTTFVPVASSLAELLCQSLEALKTIPIKYTSKQNLKISKLQKELEQEEMPVGSTCIGFELPEQEELYGDYCDDKTKNKSKNKIGF